MSIRINGNDSASQIYVDATQNLGIYHLAKNPNLYELQRSNNFEFYVPKTSIDGIVRAGMREGAANSTIENASEYLRMSVNSAFIPHFTQNVISLRRGNSQMKFAGVPEWGDGELVIHDFIGANSKEILLAWQNLSYNVHNERVGLVEDYKKDAYLIEYTPDNQKVRTWILHGCWVSGISEDAYNSESNDKRSVTATITYDQGEIDTSEN